MLIMSRKNPEPLSLPECAQLLGKTRAWLWWHHSVEQDFVPPAGTDEHNRPYWHERDVYAWAAQVGPPLSRHVPVRYWPEATEPATYLGAREITDAVAQLWDTETGRVCVLWPLPQIGWGASPRALREQIPEADTFVRLQPDFGIDGPGVATVEAAGGTSRWSDFGVRWSQLAAVLGQPVPYWPYTLRIPHLITAWDPDATTVVYPTIPEVDNTPLLRMAASLPPESPAHRVLLHLARETQHRSTSSAVQDLKILDEHRQYMRVPNGVTVAARPLPMPEVDDEDLDESTRRAGWLEILGRTDQLAIECVREAIKWDGGADFPASHVEIVVPTTTCGKEWFARLEPAERTAHYTRIDPDHDGEPLTDPATGAPVVRETDSLTVALPQRLATTSPLAELILEGPVWVRTEDGMLYPAPRHHYYGLSWGYGGSGPGSLALLISRLLEDITAPGADHVSGAPDGIEELTQHDWPDGTVLTRSQLESARDGRPYAAD